MKSQTTTTLVKSIKSLMVLFALLLSGISIAQTTVTLEDQCNCEVLQGTDVSAAGALTPAGADLGDLYVNTNTGIIYYWNGTTWELTSTDNQQLQNFTFDINTNILSLEIENGNTVTVDLASLDRTAAEIDYDNTTSLLTATNVQEAIDEINAAAGTVALVDNLDGTYTFTNAAGVPTTITDTSISTMLDNGDGTYTYTDEAGNVSTINTNGIAVSNLVAGNRIATLTEADGTISDINETITDITGTSTIGNEIGLYEKEDGTTVSIQETITSIVDNNDGNVTLVNEAGASVTISKSDITANP
ncbi:hypothetical protein, partial [Maribacter arcticus]|uniref:hypothetical protein n=2 Tax=Maribacter arcticus TaxID=561365 RepID=UPI0030451D02